MVRARVQKTATPALPSPNTKRWVARRKAAVVTAVCGGQVTLEEACRRYQLSDEEFSSWQRAFESYGVKGLRARSLQRDRNVRSSRLARTPSTAATVIENVSTIAVDQEPQRSLVPDLSL